MQITDVMQSAPTQDGDGVKISRIADFKGLKLDPFLMIDELKSDDRADYIGGFPPHPHRGIETFTYMIKGGFEHQDQMGNKKVISSGDVQWMSTGYGVIHSEMPVADEGGMHGFQIWVNMPAKDKLRPARYQDSVDSGLPVIENDSGTFLKALAGSWELQGKIAQSPLSELSADAAIADVTLAAGANAELNRSAFEQVFVFVHSGEVSGYGAGHLMKVDPSQPLYLTSEKGGGALVFSANPLSEPIAHYGPFVMNSEAELRQAVEDYRTGKFGAIGG